MNQRHEQGIVEALHQPFVIEGDAYGEDVVEENQSNSAKTPEEKLDRPRHTEPLIQTDRHLQTNSQPSIIVHGDWQIIC